MGSIIYFPEPFPDEDFRSIVFRYHLRSTNTEFYESRLELFGVQSYKQSLFPKNLNQLCGKLPIGHTFTKESFLFDHTWYGLYKVFLSPERNSRILQNIESGANSQSGQPPNHLRSVLTSNVKYCPACMEEDEKGYGEVYLHRSHQISFLEICPKHHVVLLTNCSICKEPLFNSNLGVLLKTIACKQGHRLPVSYIDRKDEHSLLQVSLLNDLISLRDHHHEFTGEYIHSKLMDQLFANGYITTTGMFLKKQLFSEFNNISSKILNALNITSQSSWIIAQIFNKERMVNFIGFYLLLARMLGGGTLMHLLDPNQASRERVFRNPQKRESAQLQEEAIIKGRNEIIEAFNQLSATTESEEKKEKNRDLKRVKMSQVLSENNFTTRSDIRKKHSYLFDWLIENDKEWIEKRVPRKIDSTLRKLDFKAMDRELEQKINAVGNSIDLNYQLPIKSMTILNFLSPYDKNHFKSYSYSGFLPLSKQAILKFVETPKQFLIRSIPRNYEKLIKKGFTKMTISLFKTSSVTYYLKGDEEVDQCIYNFLKIKGALLDQE